MWEIHFGLLINSTALPHSSFHNVALKDWKDNQREDKVKNELEIFDWPVHKSTKYRLVLWGYSNDKRDVKIKYN